MLAINLLPQRHQTAAQRFWSKVNKSNSSGCWLWTASVQHHRGGYGKLKVQGVTKRAHRVAWELTNGPVPEGLFVLHNCPGGDNPRCVNPAHLWVGTNDENMADMSRKGRVSDRRGEKHHRVKLTASQVREILRRTKEGGETQKQLAAHFGVCRSTIGMIARRVNWSHLDASGVA